MYVRKYTTKLVLNSWLSFDWNTYNYVHISSTIEIYSGVLSGVEKVPFFTPESRSGESTKLGALHNTGIYHITFIVKRSIW